MLTFLLRGGREEAEHAPEYRYLRSWVELQARRALGDVRCPEDPRAEPLALLGPEDRALMLEGERVLVTARTLALLAATLDRETVEIAAPRNVAEVLAELPNPPPLYTLRGFERLEQRVLATPGNGDGTGEGNGDAPPRRQTLAPDALPPVMLVTRRGLERVLRARLGETPAAPGAEIPLVRAGLYHEFIDYYGVERSDVLPHVPDEARRVLEVGCGRGLTGELLRRERGARVTGVELNPVVAREASDRLDRVVTGDVEDPELEAEIARGGPYDLVLALELFEHLAYPEEFLRRAAGWLADGGTILLSTPNVGHYSVVEDLLAGRWDYLPIGLLCYTHLRFFTRRTLEDWLGRLGFGDFRLIPQLTEGSERLEWLSRSPETGPNALPPGLELDRESLRTQGFYVVLRPRADAGDPSGLRDGPERGNRPAADT
jgi:2-polyprenyl-3-methyl-5-hydroxy-6-metoxy-1,4-benzoquinol methylase